MIKIATMFTTLIRDDRRTRRVLVGIATCRQWTAADSRRTVPAVMSCGYIFWRFCPRRRRRSSWRWPRKKRSQWGRRERPPQHKRAQLWNHATQNDERQRHSAGNDSSRVNAASSRLFHAGAKSGVLCRSRCLAWLEFAAAISNTAARRLTPASMRMKA